MRLNKGLQHDTLPDEQPPGSWRGARNAVIADPLGTLTNELGFTQLHPTFQREAISKIELGDGRVVVFSSEPVSEIGILSKGSYVTILRDDALNFQSEYPIQGEAQLSGNGELLIAFTDNLNPPRLLNLDKIGYSLKPDKSLVNPAHLDTSALFAPAREPKLDLLGVLPGGSLLSGVYYYAVSYEDAAGFQTKWLPTSTPVHVTKPFGSDYTQVDGSLPGTATNKAVSLKLSGLDTRYQFVRVAAVSKVNQNLTAAEFYRIGIPVTGTIEFQHSGSETGTVLTNEEVLVPRIDYLTARTLTQHEDDLFLGGLTTSGRFNYQSYANQIQVNWVDQEVELLTVDKSYKNAKNIFYFKPFLHGEVYALYLVWHLKRGGLSEAYHIPGREVRAIHAPWNTAGTLENASLTGTPAEVPTPQIIPLYYVMTDFTSKQEDPYDGSLIDVTSTRTEVFRLLIGEYPEYGSQYKLLVAQGSGFVDHPTAPDLSYETVFILMQTGDVDGSRVIELRPGSYLATAAPATGAGEFPAELFVEDAQLGPNVRYYQTRDTASNPLATTNMGYWENQNEVYPDAPEWGELSGQKVRHHRFPSIANHGYPTDATGKAKGLGIQLSNVQVPDELADEVLGYEVFYAKRSSSNSIQLGQSLSYFASHGMFRGENQDVPDSEDSAGLALFNKAATTGGNWHYYFDQDSKPDRYSKLRGDYLRLNPFDSLFNGTLPPVSYITNEKKLTSVAILPKNNPKDEKSVLVETLHLGTQEPVQVQNVDNEFYLRRVSDVQLVSGHSDGSGNVSNLYGEPAVVVQLTGATWNDYLGLEIPFLVDYDEDDAIRKFTVGNPYGDHTDYFAGKTIQNYLTNLCAYRTDVYNSLGKQDLVGTGVVVESKLTSSPKIFGGDSFLSNYGVRTTAPSKATFPLDGGATLGAGIKALYHFAVEAVSNIALRFQDTSSGLLSDQTQYYPKAGTGYRDGYLSMPATQEVKLGYSLDYSSLASLHVTYPYNPEQQVQVFPFRVQRSRKLSRESNGSSWKRFPVNDYYETVRNRGVITNLASFGGNLLIHHERSLFRTRDKTTLDTSGIKLELGSGDIFQMAPEELLFDKNGYAGTTLTESCLVSRHGYSFANQEGNIFLLGAQLQNLSQKGLSDELCDWLAGAARVLSVFDEEYNRLLFVLHGTRSETLSYSLELQAWASLHDYLPDWIAQSGKHLFSTFQRRVFLHHTNLPGRFYQSGVVQPFSLDVVFNPAATQSKQVSNLSWQTTVRDGELIRYDVTFDQLLVYTLEQVSGYRQLVYLKNVRNTENTWHTNDFRDLTLDVRRPVMRGVPLRLEPDPTNHSPKKPWHRQSDFLGKYVIARLIYSNNTGYRVSLHTVDAGVKLSLR